MTWTIAAAILPWAVVALAVTFGIEEPRPLPQPDSRSDPPNDDLPTVRIIVPARDEARNIGPCVRSLAGQDYPHFVITVVDDRSSDPTERLARQVPRRNASGIEVLRGEALPSGWFGKPWACHQGARNADEEILLFTDADTIHDPSLLKSSMRALIEDEAAALSLLGRQELGGFGERLVQPQIFSLLGLRYRQLFRPLEREQRRDAIANGQYILVRRDVYEGIGGHHAVRGEVVEDLRLAQLLTGAGHRLSIRGEPERLSTRMYRSLGEVLDGWTKNIATGAKQSAGPWGRLALAAIIGYVTLVWLIPPLVLVGIGAFAFAGAGPPGPVLMWSAAATLLGVATWTAIYRRFDVSASYALAYPVGAALVGLIALRSGWRGDRRVEWKGRRYSGGEVLGESG